VTKHDVLAHYTVKTKLVPRFRIDKECENALDMKFIEVYVC